MTAPFAPEDVEAAVLIAAWRKLGGITPPTERQEARLRDVIAYAIDDDRRRRLAAHTEVRHAQRWPEIKKAYELGQSTRQIAAWYGISHVSVRDRLRKMGIELRSRNGSAS